MGGITGRELTLLGLVLRRAVAVDLRRQGYVDATVVALVVISLMLVTGVVTWDDITSNKAAWNTLAWFATLVALAGGLSRVGFVKWFADGVASSMVGYPPFTAMVVLVLVFFFTHYLFASITAHVTALLPVILAVGMTIPGLDMAQFALLLCLTLGIMGMLTPYATGPSPVYYGSGYLPAKDFWILGAVFGVIFIAAFLLDRAAVDGDDPLRPRGASRALAGRAKPGGLRAARFPFAGALCGFANGASRHEWWYAANTNSSQVRGHDATHAAFPPGPRGSRESSPPSRARKACGSAWRPLGSGPGGRWSCCAAQAFAARCTCAWGRPTSPCARPRRAGVSLRAVGPFAAQGA